MGAYKIGEERVIFHCYGGGGGGSRVYAFQQEAPQSTTPYIITAGSGGSSGTLDPDLSAWLKPVKPVKWTCFYCGHRNEFEKDNCQKCAGSKEDTCKSLDKKMQMKWDAMLEKAYQSQTPTTSSAMTTLVDAMNSSAPQGGARSAWKSLCLFFTALGALCFPPLAAYYWGSRSAKRRSTK